MLLRVLARLRRAEIGPLLAYLGVSFLYFGRPVAAHPGRLLVGHGPDPGIFVWSLAWWPHALLHDQNPIYTSAIWAPDGLDLAWVASAPTLSYALAPVTLAAGPIVAYDVAAILLPALAAWSAYLLCRYLTGALWPSLAGGYLFGFSAFVLGHEEGHLHLTSVFLVPLIALVVVRYLHGRLDGVGLAARLGILLALQLGLSTELFTTVTLALAISLALASVLMPAARSRLRRIPFPLAAGYGVALLLASPLVYYLLTDFHSASVNPTDASVDLASLVVPTRLIAIGGSWAVGSTAHFPTGPVEQAAYLGVPTLAIMALYLRRAQAPVARFFIAALCITLVAALGDELHVDGHRLVPLPWRLVSSLPVFDNVLPVRFSLYLALVAAVVVALWAAGERRRIVRIALPALAVLALIPDLALSVWQEPVTTPAFFRARQYVNCIARGDNVLVIPYGGEEPLVWQARSGFWFRMAEGAVTPTPPAGFAGTTVIRLTNDDVRLGDGSTVRDVARAKGVGTILVYAEDPWPWPQVLAGIASPRRVGGMLLYPISSGLATDPACRSD